MKISFQSFPRLPHIDENITHASRGLAPFTLERKEGTAKAALVGFCKAQGLTEENYTTGAMLMAAPAKR